MSTPFGETLVFTSAMGDIGEIRRKKLRMYAAQHGLGPSDLSELAGGRVSYWSDLLRTDKSFGETAARKFEQAAGLPELWLDKTDLPVVKSQAPLRLVRPDEVVIPQYDTGGKMGAGGLVLRDQPGVIRAWSVSPDWVRQNVPANTGIENLCIVTGFGPSMMPMFNPGDPLLLDRGITRVEFDAVYFFALGNEGFIKLVQRVPENGAIRLRAKSKNPDYDPFWIDESMNFRVFGRILRVWKGENT